MANDYTAANLSQFSGLSIVRKRPGMYIGGTDSEALMHLLWEAIDNAVDEHLAGSGDQITVTLGNDGSVQVEDSGRGIPVDKTKDGRSGLEFVFGLHAGGKFDQEAYSVSGGLNGVGIAAIAALSNRVTATVYRDKKKHVIEFCRGVQGVFDGDGEFAPFTEKTGITTTKDDRTAAEKKARPTGTTIKWYPDYTVFDDDDNDAGRAKLDLDRIISRAKNTCYLRPELTITVIDQRGEQENVYSFNFPNGLLDMLEGMRTSDPVNEAVNISDEATFTTRGVEKRMEIEVIAQWEKSFKSHTSSFVNVIATGLGGTHVAGTIKGIEEAVVEAIKAKNMLRAKDPVPEQQDVTEGLNLIVSAMLPDPGYSTQTKERLTEAAVGTSARRVAKNSMEQWLGARKNAQGATAVLEKVIAAARARRARSAQFDVSDVMADNSKNTVFNRKPENLKECQMVGDERSELMIVEGASALGTLYSTRSSKFQALFPLKGKPLNVWGLSPERLFIPPQIKSPRTPSEKRRDEQRKGFLDAGHILLQNKELDDLVKIIGAGFGETFKLDDMRYHKIFIVADADQDGGHIEALLIGFFSTYMPQLIEDGRLYLACPPLFVVDAGSGAKAQTFLAASNQELEAILKKCRKQGLKTSVARRKGHGEAPPEEVFTCIMNPGTRKVKQITIEDAQAAQEMLQLTLGNEASLRKEWLSDPKTRALVNTEDIT